MDRLASNAIVCSQHRPPAVVRCSGKAGREQWLRRLADYQASLGAWLGRARDPNTRFLASTRHACILLSSQAHLVAAEGLLLRAADRKAPPALPCVVRLVRNLPPVAGASDDDQLTRLIERAASHQMRALSWVRQARDPAAQPVSPQRRRDMLLRAVEHIATSQRLLRRAQELPHDAELDEALGRHRAQLEGAGASVEQFIHDLDAAQEV
jgi:hypothetical protein